MQDLPYLHSARLQLCCLIWMSSQHECSPHDLQPLQHLALLSQPRLQLSYLLFPARTLRARVPLFQHLAQQVVTGTLQQGLQEKSD